ncbi:mCG147435 [Mus musculus]|nr:mCG147435 [Mus musculus]
MSLLTWPALLILYLETRHLAGHRKQWAGNIITGALFCNMLVNLQKHVKVTQVFPGHQQIETVMK